MHKVVNKNKRNIVTTESFINDSVLVHGNKYDYSLVNYINARTQVKIICKKHGVFKQFARCHKLGQGCSKCKYEKLPQNNPKDINDIICEFNKIHNSKYTYDVTGYKNKNSYIYFYCPKHGKMKTSIAAHKKNTGCELCNRYEKFVKKAKVIHGEKFDYSAVVYYNSTTQIKIICPKHGETLQYPPDHLRGYGCSECGKEIRIDKLKNNENSFRKSGFKSMAKGRKCVFYVIKCFNENELFYKIGITTHSIRRRFYGKKFPYEYEILIENEGDAETIWDMENKLKMSLKSKYTPLIEFGGCKRECFSSLNEILNLLNK